MTLNLPPGYFTDILAFSSSLNRRDCSRNGELAVFGPKPLSNLFILAGLPVIRIPASLQSSNRND